MKGNMVEMRKRKEETREGRLKRGWENEAKLKLIGRVRRTKWSRWCVLLYFFVTRRTGARYLMFAEMHTSQHSDDETAQLGCIPIGSKNQVRTKSCLLAYTREDLKKPEGCSESRRLLD